MQSAVLNIHQALLAWRHTIVHHFFSLLYLVLSQTGYQMSAKHLGVVLPVCFESEWVTQHFWRIPAVTDGSRAGQDNQPGCCTCCSFGLVEIQKNTANGCFSPLHLCCYCIYCNTLITSAFSLLWKIWTVRNKMKDLGRYTAESQKLLPQGTAVKSHWNGSK